MLILTSVWLLLYYSLRFTKNNITNKNLYKLLIKKLIKQFQKIYTKKQSSNTKQQSTSSKKRH